MKRGDQPRVTPRKFHPPTEILMGYTGCFVSPFAFFYLRLFFACSALRRRKAEQASFILIFFHPHFLSSFHLSSLFSFVCAACGFINFETPTISVTSQSRTMREAGRTAGFLVFYTYVGNVVWSYLFYSWDVIRVPRGIYLERYHRSFCTHLGLCWLRLLLKSQQPFTSCFLSCLIWFIFCLS